MVYCDWLKAGGGQELFLRRLLVLGGLFLTPIAMLLIAVSCGPPMEKATLARIDEADARWRSSAIPNYHIIVDVERSEELRRQDITVRNGRISHAIVQYWNSHNQRWENTISLNESQSLAFTVPGLLETVREEIQSNRRPIIQVLLIPDAPYLQRVILGQLWQNDHAVPNSQASVIVQKFEKQ